ncbi:MAG: T9SS type A sorting domain-containing protein [Candidatus Pseudobacter hemicellulosilyticus]|uniref:T9SS type A sorting domain-containing protein n=1 Tax=Candidatus Pseudobacter hemicellulosilyticus TaxID=3121375 RepID=A0AAJ5WYF4_9BACT|nr:MAG: T9SS type A sorting domain-containing protein [Pseudobacter sp.]
MRTILFFLACLLLQQAAAQQEYPAAPLPPASLGNLEYFVDTDPGLGNGQFVSIPATQQLNGFSFNADMTGLPHGLHRFYLRSKDANGRWSHAATTVFDNYLVPAYAVPAALPTIVAAEYFIDRDPGTGNGHPIAIPVAPQVEASAFLVDVSGLAPALHQLFVRVKDANGVWSLTYYGVFDNSHNAPYPDAPAPAPPVRQLEYYIDTDPGLGNATAVAISAGQDLQNISFDVPVGQLSAGVHTIFIRSRQNPWSFAAYTSFNYGGTLPVTWLYVRGELKQDKALLQWATGMEANTLSFQVEHSTDGLQYAAVGELKAAGESNSPQHYQFEHTRLQPGMNYYRIRQLDRDGQSAYSRIIPLLYRSGRQQTIIAPNPVQDILYVVEPQRTRIHKMEIYDAGGRLVMTRSIAMENTNFSIPVTGLSGGTYLLRLVYHSGTQRSFTFMKN